MIKLKMKKYKTILIEKQLNYQLYHQPKFVNMNILPSNQQQIIEQAKFTYFSLGKAFEQQIKTIKDQGEKQIEALNNNNNNKLAIKDENVLPKSVFGNDEAKDEFNKIKKIRKKRGQRKISL